ncbi:NAD(P)/FAD-dependent oxidoreductase [Marinisporobacter balticus]|uniref:Thioredoxin reductase n=1 Tax=Marinisporobacter balticus TaxID=2018667 RepID=A0A4R2KNV2_9FIRM|nr:FAD-dependent oxidoreductase [Marinisporobacter balticus]TCO75184.1 thioredoxin reductase [Marinisporobacter balticus]
MLNYDIVVIGGGPAGLAAAIEAKKNDAKRILVIDRDRELGGILQQCIHNGFGLHVFEEELTGPEYAQRFINELKEMDIEYKLDTMVLDISKNRELSAINTKDGFMKIKAKAIILAMGCRERTRGAIAIPGTRPAGVFTAGTAQRYMNMEGYMVGKKVVILGSGDIGLIMARRLTLEGAKVLAVAELMSFSGGLTRNIVQCLDDYNIPLLLNHTVTQIKGRDRVTSVVITEVDGKKKPIQGTEKEYECDTLLLSVGLIPENELSKSVHVKLSPVTSGPVVNESMETTIKGIFACGNVVHVHDLVDWVTKESQKAGKSAAKFIKNQLKDSIDVVKTFANDGISYIVPHVIRTDNLENSLDLLMRVKDVYKDAKLMVKANGKIIKEINKRHMAPGEMERINIPSSIFKEKNIREISVAIVKEGE